MNFPVRQLIAAWLNLRPMKQSYRIPIKKPIGNY